MLDLALDSRQRLRVGVLFLGGPLLILILVFEFLARRHLGHDRHGQQILLALPRRGKVHGGRLAVRLPEVLVLLDELDLLLLLELHQVVHLNDRLTRRVLIQDVDDSKRGVLFARLGRRLVENLQLLLLAVQKAGRVARRCQGPQVLRRCSLGPLETRRKILYDLVPLQVALTRELRLYRIRGPVSGSLRILLQVVLYQLLRNKHFKQI